MCLPAVKKANHFTVAFTMTMQEGEHGVQMRSCNRR